MKDLVLGEDMADLAPGPELFRLRVDAHAKLTRCSLFSVVLRCSPLFSSFSSLALGP